MSTHGNELSGLSIAELFQLEAESQVQVLTDGLLALERAPSDAAQLQAMMRAAHSLKGAARIAGLDAAVRVAHAMEDCFVAAQGGKAVLDQPRIDALLKGVDLLSRIALTPEGESDRWHCSAEIETFLGALAAGSTQPMVPAVAQPVSQPEEEGQPPAPELAQNAQNSQAAQSAVQGDRVLRVTADHLNRLLGLAGESRVEARWLDPFAKSLLRLKRMQQDAERAMEALREALNSQDLSEELQGCLATAQRKAQACHGYLDARLSELETFAHRSNHLSNRLYDEALALRMRPFRDRTPNYPRMVRDLARALGKEAHLEIVGEETMVDRDILELLDAPLTHLLRNAVDHGIESPEERIALGKPREGRIILEARHSAGTLLIAVRDDGRGIALETVREAVVARQLTTRETALRMTETELLEFLFLPGFTLKAKVTEISGRGVGLDVVQDTLKKVRGTSRTSSQPGKGTNIQLQLPLTLSVLRALLIEIAGEPYGLPLAAITRTVQVPADSLESLEGRLHFAFGGERVGLVGSHQLFGGSAAQPKRDVFSVVVLGDRANRYGLIVDKFLGERELVVQPLDPRLGKIKDVSAGALTDDGDPLLILDPEDLFRSLERLCAAGKVSFEHHATSDADPRRRKRVLVVDDSLTVRELERKLLESRGYEVETAIDGMDGWTAARSGQHDLIITDVDMPRLDGIELVSLIRNDPNLKSKPVMIVSYKDREEDRSRGLEAGADYYLTKGSFHDETLITSVVDLIGEP